MTELHGNIGDGTEINVTLEDGAEIAVRIEDATPEINVTLQGSGPPGPPGPAGASTWNELQEKPFERLGDTLKVEDGTLDVNIYETGNPQGGNTLYIGG